MKIEGMKIVHSLIFFYEETVTVFYKKGALKNFKKFTGKQLYWNVLFLIKSRPEIIMKKETQVFSC